MRSTPGRSVDQDLATPLERRGCQSSPRACVRGARRRALRPPRAACPVPRGVWVDRRQRAHGARWTDDRTVPNDFTANTHRSDPNDRATCQRATSNVQRDENTCGPLRWPVAAGPLVDSRTTGESTVALNRLNDSLFRERERDCFVFVAESVGKTGAKWTDLHVT